MLISERAAANHMLAWVGISRTSARRVLRTGLAGPATLQRDGSLGYDRDAVDALTRWPVLDELDLMDAAPNGIAVARLSPGREWSTRWTQEQQLDSMAGPWPVSTVVRMGMSAYVHTDGHFPLVVTMCGFILAGADVTASVSLTPGPVQLRLGPPSAWFARLRHTRWMGGRGGRALHVWFPSAELRRRTA